MWKMGRNGGDGLLLLLRICLSRAEGGERIRNGSGFFVVVRTYVHVLHIRTNEKRDPHHTDKE